MHQSSLNWFQDQLLHLQPSNERQRVELSVLFSDTPDDLPRVLAERQVDGVIIQGMEPSPACMQKLASMPHVWFMTRRTSTFTGDYVEPDNDLNGRLAADFLHSRGHKTLAVISTDPAYSAVAWRVRAFNERAKELGLAVHNILGKARPGVSYLEIAPLHEESETLVRRMLQATPGPSGHRRTSR